MSDDEETESRSEAQPRSRGRRRNVRSSGMATRRRILKAATAMFAAAGYEATSLRQIASAADIDLATLKYHYGDKPALFAEVYRLGHEEFLSTFEPVLAAMAEIGSRREVEELLAELVPTIHDFLTEHMAFIRLVLYRIMEDSSDIIGLEEELQGTATDILDAALQGLVARGLIRRIDTRALVGALVTAIPMLYVTAEVKPRWFGEPRPSAVGGRERAIAFMHDLLSRILLT